MTEIEVRRLLLLSLQRALLYEVPRALRSVTCDWAQNEIRLKFLFDGEVSEDDKESVSVVGAEVISDFPAPWTITEEIVRLDYPANQRQAALPHWAYARKEEEYDGGQLV